MDPLYLFQPSDQSVLKSSTYATGIHVRVATSLDFILSPSTANITSSSSSSSSSSSATAANGLEDLPQPVLLRSAHFAREVVMRTTTEAERSSDLCYVKSIILPALLDDAGGGEEQPTAGDEVDERRDDGRNDRSSGGPPRLHHILHVLFILHRLRHGLSGQVDKTAARLLLERMVRFVNGFFFREERFYSRRDAPCEVRLVPRCRVMELAVVTQHHQQQSHQDGSRRSARIVRGRSSTGRRCRSGTAAGGGKSNLLGSLSEGYAACAIPTASLAQLGINGETIDTSAGPNGLLLGSSKTALVDVLAELEVTRRQRVFEACTPVTLWPIGCIVVVVATGPSTFQHHHQHQQQQQVGTSPSSSACGISHVLTSSRVLYSERIHANKLCDTVELLERASSLKLTPAAGLSLSAAAGSCSGAYLVVDSRSAPLVPKLAWVPVLSEHDLQLQQQRQRQNDENAAEEGRSVHEPRLSTSLQSGNAEWADVPQTSLPDLPLLSASSSSSSLLAGACKRLGVTGSDEDMRSLRCAFAERECMTAAGLLAQGPKEPAASCYRPCGHVDEKGLPVVLRKPTPRRRPRPEEDDEGKFEWMK